MHILFVAFLIRGCVLYASLILRFCFEISITAQNRLIITSYPGGRLQLTCFVKILVCSYVFISLQAIIYSVCLQSSYLLHAFEKWYHFFVATNSKALASAALTLNASWILSAKLKYQTVETG